MTDFAEPLGPPRKLPLGLLGAVAAIAVLLGGCGGDPESSFQTTVEVHSDLTAIFTQELGEEETSVTASLSNRGGRCDGLFGSSNNKALELHSTWSPDQDPTNVDAAIEAAHRYLEERDGAEGLRTDAEGNTIFASADTAGISFTPYETSGGGSPDGAFIQSFSTVCADPETIDLADWEDSVGDTDS
ncbi:MAG: hypothetical protein QNJ89_13440 [Acidimicrobiia bacterium]|nr:hypothetical protein [Acidimicrobiia bacterium]